MWHKPGLFKTDKAESDFESPTALFASAMGSRTLKELSKDYEFFNPFLVPLALPEMPFDLITECRSEVGVPSRPTMVILNREVFDYGERGKHFGVPGNLLMLIPRAEWPAVSSFIRSIALIGASPGISCALHVQTVSLLDPQASRVGVFDPREHQVTVHAAVVENDSIAAVLAADEDDRYGCLYRLRFVKTDGGIRTAEICALFMQGNNNPITTADMKDDTAANTLGQSIDVEGDRDSGGSE